VINNMTNAAIIEKAIFRPFKAKGDDEPMSVVRLVSIFTNFNDVYFFRKMTEAIIAIPPENISAYPGRI
jgi:hypothetical protein